MRIVFFFILSFIPLGLHSQMLRVGLYQDALVERAVVYCSSGAYELHGPEGSFLRLSPGDILYLSLEEGQIRVLDARRDFGLIDSLDMRALSQESTFRVRPIKPEKDSRVYDQNLLVRPDARYLTLVNQLDLDLYLAGVVEAEAGPRAELEFYKAQALLCRTYAFRQMDRHRSEGFSLCDGTHCQAYKGKATLNPEIVAAVMETSGQIVADYNYRLITAAYHSNSGGQTTRARDVWLSDTEYLQSVVDPHSLHQPHAKWSDTIAFADWKQYLHDNGMKAVGKIPDEIIYIEQMKRKKYFILDGDSLRLTKIREDWNFSSAFFDMFPEGDSVLVWGKGYGHGIGMSQEGAMKMAREGFTYQDILQFYYFNIRLMDYRDLPASSLSMVQWDD